MKVLETSEVLDTLQKLNDFLKEMADAELVTAGATATLPLDATSFSSGSSATAAQIDEAVRDAECWPSNQWVDIDDTVAAVEAALAAAVAAPDVEADADAGPAGYEAVENANVWAYINTGDFAPDRQGMNLLVNAAHGLGSSLHRSTNMRGLPEGTPYVHALGTNTLWAFSQDGEHGGYPMITVIASGDVSAGVHRF